MSQRLFRTTRVAGALVTNDELALLVGLEAGDNTARGLALRGDAWTVLRRLTSLEMRRLVTRFDVPGGVAWRLSDAAREGLESRP